MKFNFNNAAIILLWTLIEPTFVMMEDDIVTDIKNVIASLFGRHKDTVETINYHKKHKIDYITEDFVEKKIKSLRTYLQDDDIELESKENEREDDDTTIIEFVPKPQEGNKDSLIARDNEKPKKIDVEMYDSLKKNITDSLSKNMISGKVKKNILKVFDHLIHQLVTTQCQWKTSDDPVINILGNNSIIKNMVKRRQLQATKSTFMDEIRRLQKTAKYDVASVFLHFNTFMNQILGDVNDLSDNYQVTCKLSDKYDRPTIMMRNHVPNYICAEFKICSNELKNYLLDYFVKINETVDATLRNYAAMYERDVNTEGSSDGDKVPTLIKKSCDAVIDELGQLYRKETEYFSLEKNKKKEDNIKKIKAYISKVSEATKVKIDKTIEYNLKQLGTKLRALVKDDILINIEVELNKIERQMKDKICSSFSSCNGELINVSRRKSHIIHEGVSVNLQIDSEEHANRRYLRDNEGYSKPFPLVTRTTLKN